MGCHATPGLRTVRQVATIACASALLGTAVPGQPRHAATPLLELTRFDARSATGLTRITAVHELRDGRVIVLDYAESTVLLLDGQLNLIGQLGRKGRGPGEYTVPGGLLRLPGDSVAIVDYANARWLIVTPDGRTAGVRETRLGTGCGVKTSIRAANAEKTDAVGALYREAAPVRIRENGSTELVDSAAIERWRGCHVDTVAFVPNRYAGGGQLVGTFVIGRQELGVTPFPTSTQWAVAADGRVAIVRPDPYRVDFIDPSGQRRDGATLPYERIPVTDAIKARWREEQRQPVPVMTVLRTGGGSVTMQRPRYEEPRRWPKHLPPFHAKPPYLAPDGRVWVQRALRPDERPLYDVIAEGGRFVEKVRLRRRCHITAFGATSVYVVCREDDDLEFLERHPWHR
ncbi:MAG TPA: hypothetical protein VJ717_14860 [Gemmatimonadaceae bacterium]|nr:hypothetical protein [Gemmatimonadaceae bacterium]